MSDREARERFIWFMAKNTKLDLKDVFNLMRLAATHRRIETELTNGYKDKHGNEDKAQKNKAIARRDRVNAHMESICKISYGALTVSVVIGNREVYIP